MIKLYIGGSPCTKWSIAQTKNRETEPSGIGWELFQNYVIGLHKYKPDYFLYENNKSMSLAIKEQITKELGVEPILINSALVSAQNRNRLYWTNIPGITQPEDRGILLKDILETGVAWREKSYTLDAHYYKTAGTYNPKKQHSYSRHMAAEPVGITTEGKAHALTTKCQFAIPEDTINKKRHSMAAVPCCIAQRGRYTDIGETEQHFEPRLDGKTNTITTVQKDNTVAIPHRIGEFESGGQGQRIYDINAKAVAIRASGCMESIAIPTMPVPEATKAGYTEIEPGNCVDLAMLNSKTRRGRNMTDKSNCLTTSPDFYQYCGTINQPIYEVKDGLITIKDKQYPIKLQDGYYIIRKLTVLECMRLQTVPEWYIFPVSNCQAYKMLGNGWTVDVIAHQLSFMPGIQTEEIEVMSMYDGMSCGQISLDTLGANVTRYYATEIDKYAIQTTKHNYPNTVHLGDAYQVRDAGWKLPE